MLKKIQTYVGITGIIMWVVGFLTILVWGVIESTYQLVNVTTEPFFGETLSAFFPSFTVLNLMYGGLLLISSVLLWVYENARKNR